MGNQQSVRCFNYKLQLLSNMLVAHKNTTISYSNPNTTVTVTGDTTGFNRTTRGQGIKHSSNTLYGL